jgi:hypothetical protein
MTTRPHHLLAIAVLASGFAPAGCGNTPEEQRAATDKKLDKIEDKMADSKMADTRSEWEKERADILADLRGLRDNIEKELTSTNVALADKNLKPSIRKDKEALKAELEREKSKVDGMISKAEDATDATWSTTKADINKASAEVKGWWARLKENIDKKTDADNDKDGH